MLSNLLASLRRIVSGPPVVPAVDFRGREYDCPVPANIPVISVDQWRVLIQIDRILGVARPVPAGDKTRMSVTRLSPNDSYMVTPGVECVAFYAYDDRAKIA